MIKITDWTKNVAKSTIYATADVLGENFSTFKTFTNTNQDLFKDAYSAVKDYRSTFKRVKNYIVNSDIYVGAGLAVNNIIEDLKTGNFYNPEREERLTQQYGGDLLNDENWNFDDMDFDWEDKSVSDGEKIIASAIKKNSKIGSAVISETIATSAKGIIDSGHENMTLLYLQNERILGNLNKSFESLREFTFKHAETQDKIREKHNENTVKFYKKIEDNTNKIVAELDELVKLQRRVIYGENEKNKNEKHNTITDINNDGAVDLKEYGKIVKKQLFDQINNMAGGVFSMSDSLAGANIFAQIAQNPMKDLLQSGIKAVIRPEFKKISGDLDESMKGWFSTLISRLNNEKKSENPFYKFLGNVFGLKVNKESDSVDTGKYKKGAISFDGVTKKAVTYVIPYYLRKMTSILTGEDEMVFNYNTGKFTTVKSVHSQYKNWKENPWQNSSLNTMIREVMGGDDSKLFRSHDQQERYNKDKKKFLEAFAKQNADPNDILHDPYSYGVSEEFAELMRKYIFGRSNDVIDDKEYYYTTKTVTGKNGRQRKRINGIDRTKGNNGVRTGLNLNVAKMGLASNLYEIYNNRANFMKDIENDPTNIMRILFSEGINNEKFNGFKDKHGDYDQTRAFNSPLAKAMMIMKDEYDYSLFDYLRNIKKDLSAIRANGDINAVLLGNQPVSSARVDDSNLMKFEKLTDTSNKYENIKKDHRYRMFNYGSIEERINKRKKEEDYEKMMTDRYNRYQENSKRSTKPEFYAESYDDLGLYIQSNIKYMENQEIDRYNEKNKNLPNFYKNLYEFGLIDENTAKKYNKIKYESGTSFKDQMGKLQSTGEKFALIRDYAIKLVEKPMIAAEDAMISVNKWVEDIFFGDAGKKDNENDDNKKDRSLFGIIKTRFKEGFEDMGKIISDKFTEIMDSGPIAKLKKEILIPVKEFFIGKQPDSQADREGGILSPLLNGLRHSVDDFIERNKDLLKTDVKKIKNAVTSNNNDNNENENNNTSNASITRENYIQSGVSDDVIKRIEENNSKYNNLDIDDDNGLFKAFVSIIWKNPTMLILLGAKLDNNQKITNTKEVINEIHNYLNWGSFKKYKISELLYESRCQEYNNSSIVKFMKNNKGKDIFKNDLNVLNSTSMIKFNELESIVKNKNIDIEKYKLTNKDILKPNSVYRRVLESDHNIMMNLKEHNLSIDDYLVWASNKYKDNIWSIIMPSTVSEFIITNNEYDYKKFTRSSNDIRNKFKSNTDSNDKMIDYLINRYKTGRKSLDELPQEVIDIINNTDTDDDNTENQTQATNNNTAILGRIVNPLEKISENLQSLVDKFNNIPLFNNNQNNPPQMAKGGVNLSGKPFKSVVSSGEIINGNIVPPGGPYITTIPDNGIVINPNSDENIKKQAKQEKDFLKNIKMNAEPGSLKSGLNAVSDWIGNGKNTQTVTDSVVHGGAGFGLGFLLGHPLIGATIGAASSLKNKSNGLANLLFGDAIKLDEDGNVVERSDSGLISKEIINSVPSLRLGGALGAIAGLLTPIGPIGGILVGSALGFANKNHELEQALFGAGGLDKKKLKEVLPSMGVGAAIAPFLLAGLGSPLGFVGNALVGSVAGYITTTESFKDVIMGEEDENGNRHGGIVGTLKAASEPLKNFGQTMVEASLKAVNGLFNSFVNQVINPIAKSVSPIVQEVKNKVNDTFTFLNDKLSKIGLGKQNILDFAGNVGSGIGKTAIGLGKAALWLKATPLMLGARGIQALGSHLQRKQIRRGKAYNMSAQERLDARSGKGKGILGTLANGLAWGTGDVIESGEQGLMQGVGRLFGKKLKPGFIADRYKQNDEILASMSANMSSDELQELAGALRYDPNEDDGKNIENQLDPLRTSLNDELKDTTKGIKNNYKIANKINDLVFSNRPQDAIDYINENDQLSDSQKKKMIRKVKSYSSQSNTIRNKFAATKNAYMNLDKKAKELGLDVDLSDKKQRDQLAKNIETEIKRKNNGLSEDELAKQAEWKNPDNPEYQQVNLLKEIILSLKEIGKPESERKNEITKSDEDYEREAKYRLGDQTSDFYKNMQRKAYDRIDEMDSNGRFKNEDEKNKFIEKNLDTLTQKYATESLKNKDKRLVNSGKFINNKTQYQYEEKVNKAFNSETPDGLVKGSYKYADQELEKLMKNMTFESDKEKEDYIKLNRNKIAKRHAIDSLRESDEQAINVKNESYDNIERISKKLSTLNEIGSRSDSYYNDRALEYRFTDKEKNKINTKAYKDLEKEQERRTQEKKKELEEILKNKYLNDEEKERYINSANINPTEKEVLLKKYRNQRAKEFRKEYAKNLKRNDQKYLADNIMNTNNIQDNFLSGYQEFDKTYGSRNNQFGNAAVVGGMSLGTLGLLLGNPLLGAKIGTALGGAVGGSWDIIRKNTITNRYTKGKVKKRNAQAIDIIEDMQSPKDEYGFASGNYFDGTEIHTNAEADDNLTPIENTDDDNNTKPGIISKIKSKFSKSGKKNKEVGDKDKKDKSNSIFKKFGSVLKETVGDNLSKTYDLLKDKLGQKVQEVKEHPIKKIIKFLSSVAGVPLVIGLLHKTVFPFIKDKVAPVFLGKKNADGDYEGGIISGIVNPIKNKINEKFGGVKDWVTNQGEYSDPQTGLKGMASKIGKSLFDTWIDGVDTIANTIVPTICEKVLPVVIPAIAKGIIIALPAIAKGLGKAVVEGVKTILFGKGDTSKEDSQSDYNLSSSISSSNNSVSYIDNINDSNVHSGGITSSGDEVFYSNDDVNEENALRRDENGNYYDASELMEQSNPDLVNNNAYQDMKTNDKNGTATDTKSTLIGRGAKSVLREAVGATQYGVVRRGMGTVIAGSGKTISKLPKFKLIGKGVEGFGNTLRADDIISNASSKIKTKNRSKKIYKELINNSENAIKNKSEKKIAKDLAREEAEKQIAEETAQRIATKNSKIANSFLGKTYKTVSEKIAESGLYKGAESALGKVANLKSTASTKLVNTLKKNKITGGAVEGLSKAKKWIQGIPKAISEALSKLFKSEKFLNIISKFSKNPDELIKKLTKSAEGLGSKAGKELAQKGAEETAEAAAKATAKGVAGVINIAFVIADFVTGMADARNILQITNSEIGVPEKIIAGISKVISGYVFIISESTIAKWTLESIGQLLFKDKANEILQDQKDSEEALKAYNEEHNTELTLEEYNNEYNANWYTKAKSTVTNAFKSAGDSIKSFVTGEDKKNNKSSNQSNTNIPTNASANDNLTPINNQQYFYSMYSSMLNNPVDDTLNNLGDNISTTYKRLSQLNNNTNKRIDDGSLTPDSTEYWNIKVDNTGNPFANAMYKMKESFNRLIKSPFSMVANSMGDISGIMSTSSSYSNTTNNTGGDQSNSSKGFTSSNSSLVKTTSASATSSSKKSSGIFSNIAKGIGSVFGQLFGKGKFGKGIGDHIYQRDYHGYYQTNGDTEVQTVADSGCGPAAAATVMNQYGLNGNMNNAVNYALKGGFKEINGGTYPEYFNSYLSNYGIQTQNLDNNNDVVNSLINGQPVVMMGQDQSNSGKTPYGSDYSHYVVATGLDDNGNVIVEDSEDPNGSTVYSLKDTLNNTSIKIGTGYGRGKYGKGSDNNVLSNYTKSVANAIYTPYINYMNNLYQSINIDNDNSSNQQDTNNNNSTNITNTTSSSTTQTGTTVSGATPTDKEGRKRMIWNMFIQAGFSPNLAAGILGNMQGECSTFDPNMIEGGSTGTCDLKDNKGYVRDGYSGYGICQFTGAGGRAALYNWCHKSGFDPDSLDGQVKYIIATIVGTNLDNAVDSSDPGHFGNDGSGTMSYNNRLFRTGYKGSAGGDLNTLNALSIDEACKTFFFCFERPRDDSGLYKRQGYAHNIYNELAGGTGKLGRAKSKLKFGRATDTNGGGFDRNTTDTNGGGFDRNSGTFTSKEDYIENNTTETATDNTQDTTNTNTSSSTKQSTNVSENGISYGGISDLLKGYNNALYGYVTSSSSSTSDSSNTSSSNASTNTTYNGSGNVTEGDFNTNRASCWRYLRANGFSKEATAGCIGTFVQETGLDNKNIHATSSGKKNGGLIGWTPFTKHSKWCSSNGFNDPESLESQLAHVISLIDRNGWSNTDYVGVNGAQKVSNGSEYKSLNSIENAVWAFERNIVICENDWRTNKDADRISHAKKAYDALSATDGSGTGRGYIDATRIKQAKKLKQKLNDQHIQGINLDGDDRIAPGIGKKFGRASNENIVNNETQSTSIDNQSDITTDTGNTNSVSSSTVKQAVNVGESGISYGGISDVLNGYNAALYGYLTTVSQDSTSGTTGSNSTTYTGSISESSLNIQDKFLSSNRSNTKRATTKAIVVHYVGNPNSSAIGNWNYFETGATKVSANFIIGLDGEILRCMPEDEIAYCSNTVNDTTISIENCHLGKSEGYKFNDKTYASLVKLCAYLCLKYGLDPLNGGIMRHYDVICPAHPKGKCCPPWFIPCNATTDNGTGTNGGGTDDENNTNYKTFLNNIANAMKNSSSGTGRGKFKIHKPKFGRHAKESPETNNYEAISSSNKSSQQTSSNTSTINNTELNNTNASSTTTSSNTTTVGDSASLMSKLGSYIGNSVKETYGAYYYTIFGDEGASNSSSSSSGTTSTGTISSSSSGAVSGNASISNTIAAAMQVFYLLGPVDYSHDNGKYKITLNGKEIKVRPDCSGCMSAVIYAMGYSIVDSSGKQTHAIFARDFASSGCASKYIRNADGSATTDWEDMEYSPDKVQPGDIVAYSLHTEMYWYTDSNGKFRGFSGGSGKGCSYSPTNSITKSYESAKAYIENKTVKNEVEIGKNTQVRILRYKGNSTGGIPSATTTGKGKGIIKKLLNNKRYKFGGHAKESNTNDTPNNQFVDTSNNPLINQSSGNNNSAQQTPQSLNSILNSSSSNTTTVGDSASLMSKLGSYIGNSVKETYGAYYYVLFGDEGAESSSSGVTSASTTSSGTSTITGTSNTIIAGLQVFQAVGEVPYSQGTTTTITVNGNTFSVRHDCSGYMTAVVRALGYKLGGDDGGLRSGDFATAGIASKIKNADGSDSSDWVDLPYDASILQPGDIIACHGHTEMYWFTNSSGSFRMIAAGSDEGIRDGFNDGTILATTGSVKTAKGHGFCNDPYERILRYKGNVNVPLPDSADLSKTNSTSGNVTTTDSTSTSADSTSTTAGTGRGKNNIKHKQDIINSNKNNFINTYSIRNRSNTPKTYKMQNMQSKGINYINDENYNSSNGYGRASINNGIQYEYSQQPNIIQNTNNNINYAEVLGSLVTAVQNIADNSNKTDKIIELLIAIVTNTNTKDNKKSNDAITNILRNIQNSNKNSAPITSLNQVLNSDNSNIGTAVYNIAKS